MCLSFASSWISFAGHATAVVEKRACGKDCPVVGAALIVYVAALLSFGLTFLAFVLLLSNPDSKAEKKELPPLFRDIIMVGAMAYGAFSLLLIVGMLLMGIPPGKISRAGRIGSLMFDVGGLGIDFAFWFIIFPPLALNLRRMSREEAAQAEIKL
ncbi:unnamed protein product [Urochloa humidicola]